MNIEKNKVVEFDYSLTDGDGSEIENTADTGPMLYLHGHSNILPALEAEMAGRSVGDSFEAEFTPEQAYGYRDSARVQRVPTKHILTKGKLQPGMVADVNTAQGPNQVVILKVGRFNVDVDLNHPFAGLALHFKIDVLTIRDATEDEITHGHAHGPGGHQQD